MLILTRDVDFKNTGFVQVQYSVSRPVQVVVEGWPRLFNGCAHKSHEYAKSI